MTENPVAGYPASLALPDSAVSAARSFMIGSSVVGIALGIAMLVWPQATLLVTAVLFGIALVVGGLLRLFMAFAVTSAPFGVRVFLGICAAIVLIAGVLALLNPADSLAILAIFIGVGWIVGGVQDLMGSRLAAFVLPRWLVIASGVISIVAGIAMIVLPAVATLSTILWLLAIMLIAVSIATLFTLPKKVASV